jgi:hypothetical protein
MTEILMKPPRFYYAQQVFFLGGEGSVKSFKNETEIWIYTIEMMLGPEPDFGRIGGETSILLSEDDLYAI